MARMIVIFMLAVGILFVSVNAQESGVGLGIILGEPTGLCLKKWIGNVTAIDAAVAWSFSNEDALHIHADYLVHNFKVFKAQRNKIPLYYGIGGRIKLGDDSEVGIRIPVGIDYMFENAPLDIFLEIVPLLDLAPDTEFDLNGAIGIRLFF